MSEAPPSSRSWLAAARTAAEEEKFAATREEAWEPVASIIDETRNLVEAWPTLDEAGRKALLDYWVYNVQSW